MAIKDAPTKVIDDVGQEYDPTDVVGYMENTYPEMTSEFKNLSLGKDKILNL
mgnify:CR=1 FL=1